MSEFNITIGQTTYGVDLVNDMNFDDLNAILEFLDNPKNFRAKGFTTLGNGSYGSVYGYKEFAIKILTENEFIEDDSECNDITVLKDLSHLSFIPKLYAVIDNDVMIVERIRGLTVKEFCIEGFKNKNITLNEEFVEKWDKYLLDVVANGYSPRDLHEANMMIEEHTNEPKFVDVGWFKKHGLTFDSGDVELMKRDRGYELAHSYSGNAINGHIQRSRALQNT